MGTINVLPGRNQLYYTLLWENADPQSAAFAARIAIPNLDKFYIWLVQYYASVDSTSNHMNEYTGTSIVLDKSLYVGGENIANINTTVYDFPQDTFLIGKNLEFHKYEGSSLLHMGNANWSYERAKRNVFIDRENNFFAYDGGRTTKDCVPYRLYGLYIPNIKQFLTNDENFVYKNSLLWYKYFTKADGGFATNVISTASRDAFQIKAIGTYSFNVSATGTYDIFLVGQGGCGSSNYGGGGGGGYTTTAKNLSFRAGDIITVNIPKLGKDAGNNETNRACNGGTTTFVVKRGSTTVYNYSAAGGQGGSTLNAAGDIPRYGGNGGSGGGGGNYGGERKGGQGGSDGADGSAGTGKSGYGVAGTGQGTTTKMFGETYGDPFSGGGAGYQAQSTTPTTYLIKGGSLGGGSSFNAKGLDGIDFTGGGGAGAANLDTSGIGGCGTVIIRPQF